MSTEHLKRAKREKNDEFYTRYEDIEKELKHYIEYDKNIFRDKVILCPCDDPDKSNFTKYFKEHFEELGIKKLICTCLAEHPSGQCEFGYELTEEEMCGKVFIKERVGNSKNTSTGENKNNKDNNDNKSNKDNTYIKNIGGGRESLQLLRGDGDFASEEVSRYRDEADYIITNPPFSIYRKFMAWIEAGGVAGNTADNTADNAVDGIKKFLILSPIGVVVYQTIFPKLQNREWHLGFENVAEFETPTGIAQVAGLWITNMQPAPQHPELELTAQYKGNENKYPKFDNYDAIVVDRVENIPRDYKETMAVPITFLLKWNPEQFEIIGIAKAPLGNKLRTKVYKEQWQYNIIDGKEVIQRVLKMNDEGVIKLDKKPQANCFYRIGDEWYKCLYPHILIKVKH